MKNAYQILESREVEANYVVEGLLPTGLIVFTGREKIGKSFFLLQLAGSICKGNEFLNYQGRQGGVLYLALEDNDARLSQRMMKQNSFASELDFITEKRDEETLEDIISEYMKDNMQCKCIIVDHLLLAIEGAITAEYGHDVQVARKLKQLADKYNVALILVIHEKKGKANSEIEKVIGRGLSATADCVLRLSREDSTNYATLYHAGRDHREEKIAIEFVQDTCTWKRTNEVLVEEIDYNLSAIINYVVSKKEVCMSAQELASVLKLKLNPISIASLLDRNQFILSENGISLERGRTNGKRKCILKYNEIDNTGSADSADLN